jgi:hypothetical protein
MNKFRFISLFIMAVIITGALALLTLGCDKEKDSNSSPFLLLGLMNQGPKRIFVTDAVHNGNFGGVSGADAFCMNETDSGTWKAIIASSERTFGSNWVLKPDTTYYRLDGTTEIFTTNEDAVFDFSGADFTNPISTSDVQTWTGMNDEWDNMSGIDCSDWNEGAGSSNGRTGDANATDSTVLYLGEAGSSFEAHVICVEQ